MDSTQTDTLRVLDVCAGSGMLGEGLCAAIPESRVVGFVERQAHSAAVLLERMESQTLPPAPIWCGDLTELDPAPWRGAVDCVVAGFPCQPWSLAGSRGGTEDERWILPDILDLAVAVGAPLIALENNRGLDVAEVISQLDRRGYVVAWCGLEAADVGAAHHRFRWFFVAYSDRYGQHSERVRGILDGIGATLGHDADGCGGEAGSDSSESRLTSGGLSGGPQSHEKVQHVQPADSIKAGVDKEGADTFRRRCGWEPGRAARHDEHRQDARRTQGSDGAADGGEARAYTDSLRQRPDELDLQAGQRDSAGRNAEGPDADSPRHQGRRGSKRVRAQEPRHRNAEGSRLFAYGPQDPRSWQQAPETQPAVGELVHGMAEVVDLTHRKQQLWLIGNGVVPLQAAVAYRVLAHRLADHLEREAAGERADSDHVDLRVT